MNSIKSVSVCGLGKLGACMAATFAARGFNVVGVDIDPEKIRKVNAGEPRSMNRCSRKRSKKPRALSRD